MYVELKDINKHFNNYKASDHVSFGIEKGKLIGLLGPSGSGKTTILRMIAGLEQPDSGEIIIDGKVVNDVPASKRGIGFVFQNYNLVPVLNVYENVVLPIELDGTKIDTDYVQTILHTLGLEEKAQAMPNQLSGGQQQRLCIARALAVEPEVLLMDESTSALDPISTLAIEDLMSSIVAERAIVIVTHNMEQASRVSNRTAFFYMGDMVEYDETDEIFQRPKDKRLNDYLTGMFS